MERSFFSRSRTRGSVLILCLGIVVVLAMMATALISTLTLHRAAAKNVNIRGLAELTALGGQAWAISKIVECYMNTAANGATYSPANADPDKRYFSEPYVSDAVENMWAYAGLTTAVCNQYGISDGKCNWMYFKPNDAPQVMPSEYFGYTKDWTYSTKTDEIFYVTRFAVSVMDLGGCWDVNVASGLNTTWEPVLQGMLNTAKGTWLQMNIPSNLEMNTDYYSWEHINNSTTLPGGLVSCLTPFYVPPPDAPDNATIPFHINLFTAPYPVLDAMILGIYSNTDIPKGWHSDAVHGFGHLGSSMAALTNSNSYSSPATGHDFLWDIVVALHNTVANVKLNAATYSKAPYSGAHSIKYALGQYFLARVNGCNDSDIKDGVAQAGKIHDLYSDKFSSGKTYTDSNDFANKYKQYAFPAARMEQMLNDVYYNVFGGNAIDWDSNAWNLTSVQHEYTSYPDDEKIRNVILGGSTLNGGSTPKRFDNTYSTSSLPLTKKGTGRFYVGPSRFYRVIVRAQVYNLVLGKAESEANLEFVYVIDPNGDAYTGAGNLDDSRILFQRWIDDK